MSNITISYWRTYIGDVSITHLAYGPADVAICGFDLAGDDTIHSEPPKRVRTRRISCDHCQAIIEAAIEHKASGASSGASEGTPEGDRRGLGVTPVDPPRGPAGLDDEKDPDAASISARWSR